MGSPASGAVSLQGRTLGHYKFLALIGRGGMGEVYRAYDERLSRDVAVKVLPGDVWTDEAARRRFRREALALSKLNHPNIATLHDFESSDDRDLLVMEHVAGETLDERLGRGPLDEDEVARLGRQLAQGLAAAHDQGVIHRDLKPHNIRITPDGRLKILDFGLSMLVAPSTDQALTQTHNTGAVFCGTPAYMSPEQLRGKPGDRRTDIYGAGIVLFEMATGRRPFDGQNLVALAECVLHEPPPSPRSLNSAVSADLERIITKALAKDPALRYQSAGDLAADLLRLGGRPDARPRPLERRRFPRWALVALATASVAALAVAGSLWMARSAPPPLEAFRERDWVLVADVADADGVSGSVVREALTLGLQQSRYVNVIPRDRVAAALGRMERPAATRIDETTGLDLIRRENVRMVLAGHIASDAGARRISIRGLDASGVVRFVEHARVALDGSDLLDVVDDVSRRVRQRLGESLTQIAESRPLAQVTTRSTDALDRYSHAIDRVAQGQYSEAEAALEAALALDPGFAMAHVQLARVHLRRGDAAGEREHLDTAFSLRDKLTVRERLTIEGAYYQHVEDYARSEESLRTLVGLHPDDAEARQHLAMGAAYNGKKHEAAVQLAEAVRLDPHSAPAASRLVLVLAELGRNDDALAVADAAAARGHRTSELQWARAMALFGKGDLGRARAELEALARADEAADRVIGQLYLIRLALYEGRFAEAAAALEAGVRADRQARRRYPERVKRYLLGRLAALQGRKADAREQAAALERGSDVRVTHLHHAAYLRLLASDLAGAQQVLTRLRALGDARRDGFTESSTLHLEGEIRRRLGQPNAEERLREADAVYPIYHAHVGLAELAEERRDWPVAAREWREVVAARGVLLRDGFPVDCVVASWRLARAEAAMGRAVEARAHYREAIAAWERGDDTALRRQLLAEARANNKE